MSRALLIQTAIFASGLFACFITVLWFEIKSHQHTTWRKQATFHLIQTALLVVALIVAQQYLSIITAEHALTRSTEQAIDFATICIVSIILLRQTFRLITLFGRHEVDKGRDPTQVRVVVRLLKITLLVILTLLFGEHFGLSLSGLMAFGGIGGIAIGLASKDILSNFFSGIFLFYDRQFSIGDWISSPDRNIEGTVVEIGWRITKIITFDNRPMYIPNSLFSSISVQNPGRMTNRRISTVLGLRYDDAGKVDVIVSEIREALKQNPHIDTTQDLLVYFNEFADSTLNIMVYCFTKTTAWAEWLQVQQDVFVQLITIVHEHGADFAYPTQQLYVNSNSVALSNGNAIMNTATTAHTTHPDTPLTNS